MDFEDSNSIESDNDILLRKYDFENIEIIIDQFCCEYEMTVVQQYDHSLFGKNIILTSKDRSDWLNLDFYYKLFYNGVQFETNELLFEGAFVFQKRKNLVPKHDFTQYFLKKINKGLVSKEGFAKLSRLYLLDREGCNKTVFKYIDGTQVIEALEYLGGNDLRKFQASISSLELPTKPFLKLLSKKYYSRILSRAVNPTGLTICFLGPDGAGKSSVIDELLLKQLPFRRHDYFHLFPLRRKKSTCGSDKMPSRNNNYSMPRSMKYSKSNGSIRLSLFLPIFQIAKSPCS
ncbi:hypothetical protein N9005_06475 [Akkermansiaceae bacterium]|nr:hypothetical protein [Akkermansiaceae bacterium]